MTQWTERFRSHRLWQALEDLGAAADIAAEQAHITSPDHLEGLGRVKAVLAFAGKTLAGAEPYLMPSGRLDQMAEELLAATAEVRSFATSGETASLNNANSRLDSLLQHLAATNVVATTEAFVGAKEAAQSYRRFTERALNEVQSRSDQIRGQLDELNAKLADVARELTSERQRFQQITTEFQGQFSTAQEARGREHSDAERARSEQFHNAIADLNQRVADAERRFADVERSWTDKYQTLQTQYEQSLSTVEARFDQTASAVGVSADARINELTDAFVKQTEVIRDDILRRKGEVEKLVGVIGNLGVTSGYLTAANEARVATRVWQGMTVLSMLGLVAMAYFAFLPSMEGNFTWSAFAGRVFVSLSVGVLAAYAGTQADKYQKSERQNRRLALELEALGPFIAPLAPDKQESFRLTIGDRSFGQHDGALDGKSPTSVADLAPKDLRDLVTSVIKATKTS